MSTTSGVGRGRGRGRGSTRSSAAESRSDTPVSVGGSTMSEVTSGMSGLSVGTMSTHGTRASEAELEEINSLIPRPGYGTAGRLIPLKTNYFEVNVRGPFAVHHYDLNISRPGRDRKLDRDECRDVFWKIVSANRAVFGKEVNLVYDDASCLLTSERLADQNGWFKLELALPNGRVTHQMEVKYTASVTIRLGLDMSDQTRAAAVQFLDALITQGVRCPLTEVSRMFYPFGRSIYFIPYAGMPNRNNWAVDVGPGIEAWRGLHGAIKIDENGVPMLNADLSTSAFYKLELELLEFYLQVMREFQGANPRGQPFQMTRTYSMDEQNRRRLNKALAGVNMRLTYGSEQARLKTFKYGEALKPASVATFTYQERDNPNDRGREMTVEEYFATVKGIRLQFPNLPVIRVGPRTKNICIPFELLKISDKPQKVKRELSDFQKAKLIRDASMKPEQRKMRISDMTRMQGLENDDFMRNFNVTVSKDMVKVNGRVLNAPELALLHPPDQKEPFHITVNRGMWDLRNQFTLCPKNVIFEAVNVDGCFRDPREFWDPFGVLCRACALFGMRFVDNWDQTNVVAWTSGSRDELKALVQSRTRELRTQYGDVLVMFIFFMAGKFAPTYSTIKTVCDIEVGVASQVLLRKTFFAMRNSNPETNATAKNICLKLNVKLGGINNQIFSRYPVWPKFSNPDDPTIFVGIDVTHPKPGKRGNSIATVVASVDVEASRYQATVKVQLPGAERVVYVVDAIKERLLAFYRNTNSRPGHIVIYRDGISESEFLNTVREEVASVMTACKKLDIAYMPTVTYIIVQKRHHTRFFVENPADAEKDNIPPGTVVDRRVVTPNLFDFFLASHLGAIGTSRPSHYYVLYDSWKLSADDLQQVTYALCHLYCRCPRSVSIPAPVYYAHLACYRASVHDDALYGSRSSQSSQGGERAEASAAGGRSEQETSRTHQAAITVSNSAPEMYFV